MLNNSRVNTAKKIIVIDVGGTNFRSALFSDGRLVEKPKKFLTPNFITHKHLPITELQELLIQNICDVVLQYKSQYPSIKLVGLSFPGPISESGVVHQAPTVWGNLGKEFPIIEALSNKLKGIRFVVVNDITAAAERYAKRMKQKGFDFFGVITVSSGIGSKIYDTEKQKVLLDKESIGGEMGHVKVDFSANALLCDCGGKGHIGAISSGRGVERLTKISARKWPLKFRRSCLSKLVNKPTDISNKQIVSALRKNDSFVRKILDQSTQPLAIAISHLSANIGVHKFIIIGGFSLNVGKPYLNSLTSNLLKLDFFNLKKSEVRKIVQLGINDDNNCLVGVGLLVERMYERAT